MALGQANINHRHIQPDGQAQGDRQIRDREPGYFEASPRTTSPPSDVRGGRWRRYRWVVAALALLLVLAVGYATATRNLVEVPSAEGTWKLVKSTYIPEQGFVFLVGDMNRVQRSYPMPGGSPNWLSVGEGYVYAGRIGDGGEPNSGLVRIDRASLEATVVAVPISPDPNHTEWPDDWFVATPAQAAAYSNLVGSAAALSGTEAHSTIGPVFIDPDGIDGFVDMLSS